MADKDSFAKYLRSKGLDDTDKWQPKFEKLGVQSEKSLQFLEGDKEAIEGLKKDATNVEKKAIDNLFVKEKDQRDPKELLKELEKAKAEGLSRHNQRVQALESAIRTSLGITSKDFISNDSSLEKLISKLESELKISGQVISRDKLDQSLLLQKVSGGLALRGIYLTKQADDQLKERDQLLRVPNDILITGLSSGKYNIEQFSSSRQEDKFVKTIETLGYSVAVSASGSFLGFSANASAATSSKTEDEKTTKFNEKESYSSTVKFSTIYVASYSFKSSDLIFSSDAKAELETICAILKSSPDSDNVQFACEQFFKKYGSHANRGPLSFGGIFKYKCTSRGFSRENEESVKHMQTLAVSADAGASFGGFGASTSVDVDKYKGSFTGSFSKETKASTVLEVTIHGGPPEAADIPSWNSGLVANNNTWVLIDRGMKVEAVWDIIDRNYRRELGDVAKVLRISWERITGLNAERNVMLVLSHYPTDVADNVLRWSERGVSKLTSRQIESILEDLVDVRRDIIGDTSNPSVWIDEFLTQPSILELLSAIADLDTVSEHIHFLVAQLLVKEELKYHDLAIQSIPIVDKITKWLDKARTSLINQDQNKAVEDIVDNLCSYLEGSVRAMIEKSLGRKIVGQMKDFEYHFESRQTLKVKILTDLKEKDDFNSYMTYATNVKKSIEDWLRHYTVKFSDKEIFQDNTRLQILAKEEVSRLMQVVETACSSTDESISDVPKWLIAFSSDKNLREFNSFVKLETTEVLEVKNLQCHIVVGIKILEEKLRASFNSISCGDEMKKWEDQPHEILKDLVGCQEQCPFCGEQCDLEECNHSVPHKVLSHRSVCLAGFRDSLTEVLDTDTCPFLVESEEKFRLDTHRSGYGQFFRDYRTVYPKWSFSVANQKDSLYWFLFLSKFEKELAARYEAKPPVVLEKWRAIEWLNVTENLKKIYNL